MMNDKGDPWPSFYAKKLCTQHVRPGDFISFPTDQSPNPNIDVVVARGEDGRRSALVVHLAEQAASYDLAKLVPDLSGVKSIQKIDHGTGKQIVTQPFDGKVHFDGFGVAAVRMV